MVTTRRAIEDLTGQLVRIKDGRRPRDCFGLPSFFGTIEEYSDGIFTVYVPAWGQGVELKRSEFAFIREGK